MGFTVGAQLWTCAWGAVCASRDRQGWVRRKTEAVGSV